LLLSAIITLQLISYLIIYFYSSDCQYQGGNDKGCKCHELSVRTTDGLKSQESTLRQKLSEIIIIIVIIIIMINIIISYFFIIIKRFYKKFKYTVIYQHILNSGNKNKQRKFINNYNKKVRILLGIITRNSSSTKAGTL
jgi:hypothetical protein